MKTMKNKILISAALVILLVTAEGVNAQTLSGSYEGQAINLSVDPSPGFTLSKGFVEFRTYKRWKAKDFPGVEAGVVYRSLDGLVFKVVEQKKSTGVFSAPQVAYYLKDENPVGVIYYKLIPIAESNVYQVGKKISVIKDEEIWSSNK
jgi:hypothetical protein